MTANSNCSTRGDTFWDLRFYSDRKYFVALIIRCRKYFECLIFGHHCASEIVLTPKFSQTTVLYVSAHELPKRWHLAKKIVNSIKSL